MLTNLIIPHSQDVARVAGCLAAFYGMAGRMDGGISGFTLFILQKFPGTYCHHPCCHNKRVGDFIELSPLQNENNFYYSPAYRTTKNLACKNFSFVLHFSGISYSIS